MAAEHLRPLFGFHWGFGFVVGASFALVEMIALLTGGPNHRFEETIWWGPKYCGEGRFQAFGGARQYNPILIFSVSTRANFLLGALSLSAARNASSSMVLVSFRCRGGHGHLGSRQSVFVP